jgi:large subunit ribosomal protein L24
MAFAVTRPAVTRPCAAAPAAPRRGALAVVAARGGLPRPGGGKAWERVDVNANGKPVKVPMHVKLGDTVQVIAGADKGAVAKVSKVLTTKGMVVVEGVNKKLKNVAPKTSEETGKQETKEYPIHHSNVMLYSESQKVRSRVGHKVVDGKKVRVLVKTGEVLP